MIKNILGLDLGTNSIGWALIQHDFDEKKGKILGMGSRIIPMSQDILGDFENGNSQSQTAERTRLRSTRRLRERFLLRRERLHRILHLLGFLPNSYSSQIDFEHRLGKFKNDSEPKIAYNNNQFIFKNSFEEMLSDFRQYQPQILLNKKGEPALIPYDWTLYYLRKKALTQKIDKEELAWILLNFNQKRGYYQLRGEEDEDATKTAQTRTYFDTQIISEIKDTGILYKGLKVSVIKLANGDSGKYFSKEIPKWVGIKKNIIATVDLDKYGNDKLEDDGTLKRRFSIPTEDDWDKKWKLVKIKTEREITDSKKTVGAYIYDTLLQNPKQKILGKLVRTIERKFYKQELKQILEKQVELQPELFTTDLLIDCARELYRNNLAHQHNLQGKDFVHIFLNDIIFYQRPLRSKKSLISNCSLEFHKFKDTHGNYQIKYLKSIPKSNPIYQEFRIWQWMHNLAIYRKEDDNNPVTAEFLKSVEDWEQLFDFLNSRKEVEQKSLIKYLLERNGLKGKKLTAEVEKYRWNYVEDKSYPCNETKALITNHLSRMENIPSGFLTSEVEQRIWHLVFSVNDKVEFEKGLKSFARKHSLDESLFVAAFKTIPPFKREYGAFSEKAIKKLLPLMRLGKFWTWENIDNNSKDRIQKIISGEFDENIRNRVREKAIHLNSESNFQGLQLWLAQYIVYDRHAEAAITGKWSSPEDVETYLKDFKQHSLRNPIVEQVVTESLRVVKDIWNQYGDGANNFFNEIHIELGREMKNTAEERKKLSNIVIENENTNLRIKSLLAELATDQKIENVRPYSPIQQEILKIYEEGILNSAIEIEEDILKISKTAQPTSSDLKRYKLWLEQKYKSPYTGQIIPLNKLFTPEYEIEHIIPQSRYFDDSLSNKVICEAAVNRLKGNNLGFEFIKKFHGQIVELGNFDTDTHAPARNSPKTATILSQAEYEDFVRQNYAKNKSKRHKLLLDEIPEKMIERQMNDTRYISKFISGLLSNIVRAENNDDGFNSKNIVPGNGKITLRLKQDWGLNDVWNELILARFERLNQLTNTTHFTSWNDRHQKYIPTVPIELSRNFQKKRIDHRHHAMDALVIACATRDHVNLLNNQSANSDSKRYDLQNKLRLKEKWIDNEGNEKYRFADFKKPWENFTLEAKNALENIVVSFKKNLRVINKATNLYEKYVEINGEKTKELVPQKGTNWAIRKSMHKDTVSGKVELSWYKVPKGKILTATRKSLDSSFDLKTINSITDTGIQKILKNYLLAKSGNAELAFSPEGIEELNKNITQYNDGKLHQPILKVRIFESGSKFQVGNSGNKKHKYVEAAKGTNLFFAVYEDATGKRSFKTVPLNEVIERLKQGLSPVSLENKKSTKLKFYLSPNDLVYVPQDDDTFNLGNLNLSNLDKKQTKRIYKFISCTEGEAHFIPHTNATEIIKNENGTNSKSERLQDFNDGMCSFDINGKPKMIKEICVKLNVDRLGNIRNF